jgi:glycosyltransferase involved in cell wall biosynthesis
MKVLFFSDIEAEEGPGFIFGQVRQALEDAGALYKHKSFPNTTPVEFDRGAIKELEKCDLLVYGGEALALLRKAKKMGVKTLGLSLSTQVTYRERLLDGILFRYGVDIKSPYAPRVKKAEKFTDYFLCLSFYSKYTYIQNGTKSDRIFVVPSGVDTEKFSFAEQNLDSFKVLFVGTNPIRKGLLILLKAWKELDIKGELINRSGIVLPSSKGIVNKPEFVTQEELATVYQNCSLTILPSFEEGLAATNLESMGCGRPIIASNVSGIEDVITDYKEGILIPSGDVKAIKDAILYFYENREELVRMGVNAREKAEEYPWSRFREGVVGVVKKILENEKT